MAKPAVNLVVVAHPDDEVLGMGGTGAKLTRRGETVQPVMLCGRAEARARRPEDDDFFVDIATAMDIVGFDEPVLGNFPNIKLNTVAHLDLVQFIEEQIIRFAPLRIFTHHVSDANDDHRQLARACLVAARISHRRDDVAAVESIHLMETPSATDWTYHGHSEPFRPNEYVEIGHTLDLKLQSCAAYRNVMRPFPHSRSEEVIRGLAAVRGGECGLGYAEAFQSVYSTRLS